MTIAAATCDVHHTTTYNMHGDMAMHSNSSTKTMGNAAPHPRSSYSCSLQLAYSSIIRVCAWYWCHIWYRLRFMNVCTGICAAPRALPGSDGN
jgi:hypothetical protein